MTVEADCLQGKHPACPGWVTVERNDDLLEEACACECHQGQR